MLRLVFLLFCFCCLRLSAQIHPDLQIAFIADIHFQDDFGEYKNFEGLPVPGTSKNAKIRTMAAQLHSTRLFNENYFALRATLDDIAARGIKIVALPGDYTDDGQPIHVKGLAKILKEYRDTKGMSFFITTGNHDPSGPFQTDAGKTDFLGENGKNQPIFSKKGLYKSDLTSENKVLIEPGLAKSGYREIFNNLSDFGFFPKKNYVYWETPFSDYTEENYRFKNAKKASKIDKRTYKIAENLQIPDASYLVEPVEGLWILAIDGNSYLPHDEGNATKFSSASLGYNQSINHKKHLFKWIKSVAERAKKHGKTLIAFSHYPAVDFNDDASAAIGELLGENKWQLERVPEETIAETLAKAGIKVHVAGHMHINDTGLRTYENGDFIVNIQTPSLGAYIPGYKILTINTPDEIEVNTVAIENVLGFDSFFPLYKMESEYLAKNKFPGWDDDILKSKSYLEFTNAHLKNLLKLRFLPEDWPKEFQEFLTKKTGQELLQLSNSNKNLDLKEDFISENDLKTPKNRLKKAENSLILADFETWTGFDLLFDFYRMHSADVLARPYIGEKRLAQYNFLISEILKNDTFKNAPENSNTHKLWLFMGIFKKFLHGQPADHFSIDLKTGELTPLD